VVDRVRARIRAGELKSAGQIRGALKAAVVAALSVPGAAGELALPAARPGVVLVMGVNGGGKTTTIGKLAHKLRQEGASVRARPRRWAGLEPLPDPLLQQAGGGRGPARPRARRRCRRRLRREGASPGICGAAPRACRPEGPCASTPGSQQRRPQLVSTA